MIRLVTFPIPSPLAGEGGGEGGFEKYARGKRICPLLSIAIFSEF